MTEVDIKVFKLLVADMLVKQYHLNRDEATQAVQESYLSDALAQDSGFVGHDTVEEWADFVYAENERKNGEV